MDGGGARNLGRLLLHSYDNSSSGSGGVMKEGERAYDVVITAQEEHDHFAISRKRVSYDSG